MPWIKGYPPGEENKIVSPQGPGVMDGIANIPVPGNVELDAAFEAYASAPDPLSILRMITEEE